MQPIHELLYLISNAFLLPTLLGTLLVFGYGTYVVGRFLSDWVDFQANSRLLRAFFAGPPTQARYEEQPWRGNYAVFQQALRRWRDFPAMLDKQVTDLEHEMTAQVDRLGVFAKVGPMLGLIGTLIPLQPALAGLARGDLQVMGANLQIGFTTTVLGLLTGGACYAISVVLRNWNQQTVANLHFLLALWAEELEHHEPFPAPAAAEHYR